MVMCYFKWSGVLAIRTMQCIPMLFLYDTLHLYYTPVGFLARLLILLPYVDPVCQLRWLLSSLLLTSSISCTAATLTNWIVFLFLLHATLASCFILFLNSISNLCPSLDSWWQKLHSHAYTRAMVCSFVSFTYYLSYLRRWIATKIRLWRCLLHRSSPSHSW
jgi:hypothetical protein